MTIIICLFKGHNWSQWYAYPAKDKQYRYCIRCGEIEYRLGSKVVKANPKERLRNIYTSLVNLGEPSFEVSMEQSYREGLREWYYHIPRDVLNDGIKCLTSRMRGKMRAKNFDFSRFNSFGFFLDCPSCQNYRFCENIIRSMQKVYKKYERKEKVQKRGNKMRIAAGILIIIGGLLGGTLWFGISEQLLSYFLKTYTTTDPASTAVVLAFPLLLVRFLPVFLAVIGGIYALKGKRWGWALFGAICSLLFPFTGIPAIVLLVKSKGEFQS